MLYQAIFEELEIRSLNAQDRITASGPVKSLADLIDYVQNTTQVILTLPERKKLREEADQYCKDRKKKPKVELQLSESISGKANIDTKEYIAGLQLFQVQDEGKEGGKYKLFDTINRRLSKTHIDGYFRLMGIKSKMDIPETTPFGTLVFSPERVETTYVLTMNKRGDVQYFNEYNPPAWRFLPKKEVKDITKNTYYRVIRHVFPDESDFRFSLSFMYNAGRGKKSETYLCVIGSKGCGKTKYWEILTKYVGVEYCKGANKAQTERFNSAHERSLAILYDEFDARDGRGEHNLEALKRDINNRISLETKNNHARDIRNFASPVILNNSLRKLGVEIDERRFSFVRPNTIGLRKVLSDSILDNLTKEIHQDEDDPSEELVEFCQWVEDTPLSKEYSVNHVHKNDYFYVAVEQGYTGWREFFRSFIIDNRNSLLKDIVRGKKIQGIKDEFHKVSDKKSRFPKITDLQDFLLSSPYWGKEVLGVIEKDSSGKDTFFINLDFINLYEMKNTIQETNEDEFIDL